jgi:hypothetical protein
MGCTGTVSRRTGDSILVVAVVVAAAIFGVLDASRTAQARQAEASERFDLAREIPTPRFALLNEGRIAASYWAAYVYRDPRDTGEGAPCAYIGAIDFISPTVGFFKYAGECGGMWPAERVRRPALGFIRQRTYYHGRSRAEGMGLLLVAQTVRRIRINFRGNSAVWAAARELSGSQVRRAQVPALRYVTFAVHLDRCISAVTAYDARGKRVGVVSYPNCHT